MRFADGLPINLKYPVLPKPKPPLPLFSTMPRTSKKSSEAIPVPQCSPNPLPKSPVVENKTPLLPSKQSQTLSSIHHNNNVKKKSKESVFSTLKLRSPKKTSILESMSTLRKSKPKQKSITSDDKPQVPSSEEELKQAETLLKNLSFSTDFASLNLVNNNGQHGFYNVPKNNAAVNSDVVNASIDSRMKLESKTNEEVEYFTKSDIVIEKERNQQNSSER